MLSVVVIELISAEAVVDEIDTQNKKLKKPLNKSSATECQIFCPSRSVPKTGNTYDLASDAADDRWACTIDMTKNHHHAYIYIKTNDWVRSNYSYPYLKQWNDDNYLREKDGEFYRKSC